MSNMIIAALLLGLSLLGVIVRKAYFYVPERELQRQAKTDEVAARLYQAVSYGDSLRGLLMGFILLTSAAGFVLLARVVPLGLSLIIVVGLLWATFAWLPSSRLSRMGAWLATAATPLVLWLLRHLHPRFGSRAASLSQRLGQPYHSGLYERQDLLELINRQQLQTDNRLSGEELEIARRALTFDEHTVSELMTPRKETRTVLADDTVGPVFIDEVHRSGQDYILVRQAAKGPYVGVIERQQLGLQSSGQVSDIMRPQVYYLHKNDSLTQALHAFFTTNFPVFIIVDDRAKPIGIITIEAVLRQLLGHIPGDDFDQYSDPAAVSARHALAADLPPGASITPDEVIE